MKQRFLRLWKQMTADKRRFSLAVSLALIGLLMWGRLLLKKVPKTAIADPDAVATSVEDSPAASRRAWRTVEVELSDVCARDVFALEDGEYSKLPDTNVKPPPNLPDQKSEEEIKAELARRISALKVKSVLMAEKPQALINDRFHAVGDEPVPGFVITKISPHSVTLHAETEGGSYQFELQMYASKVGGGSPRSQ